MQGENRGHSCHYLVVSCMQEDLKVMGYRNWRRNSQDRYRWRAIVEEAKVRDGL